MNKKTLILYTGIFYSERGVVHSPESTHKPKSQKDQILLGIESQEIEVTGRTYTRIGPKVFTQIDPSQEQK